MFRQVTALKISAALAMGALLLCSPASHASPRGGAASISLRLTVGQPTLLTLPAVRGVDAADTSLRVETLSSTAVRVAALQPGTSSFRLRTADGWETFRVQADAIPRQAAIAPEAFASPKWLGGMAKDIAGFFLARSTQPVVPAPVVSTHQDSIPMFRVATAPRNPKALRLSPQASGTRLALPMVAAARLDPGCASPALLASGNAPLPAIRPMPASFSRLSIPLATPSPRVDPALAEAPSRLSPQLGSRMAARLPLTPQAAPHAEAVPSMRVQVAAAPASSGRGVQFISGARPMLVSAGTIPGLPEPAETASDTPLPLSLVEGRSRILTVRGVRTIQIDDAAGTIAEVQPISRAEVLVLAKGPGTTTLRIWDERGRTEYDVTVSPSPARRQQAIQDAIGIQGVKVKVVEDTAVLDGDVPTVEQMVRAQRIAEAFVGKVVNLLRLPAPPPAAPVQPSLAEQVQAVLPAGEVTAEALAGQPNTIVLRGVAPKQEELDALVSVAQSVVQKAGGTVVNLVQIARPRQVRVQARLINVDERFLRELGIRWSDELTVSTLMRRLPGEPETDAATDAVRLLSPIEATIKAAMNNGRSEILAAPSILVNSGAMGNIMIGGEVPIPMVVSGVTGGQTSSGGVGTVGQSVIFRTFGVLLNIEPVVEPGGDVTLRFMAEVSAVDQGTAVTVGNSNIPGFSTKRTQTELRLKAGETLVIGGLISREESNAVNKFPILGDIPVLGNFFRSVRREKQMRELVLFLTPEILPGPEPPVGLRQTPTLPPSAGPVPSIGQLGGSGRTQGLGSTTP